MMLEIKRGQRGKGVSKKKKTEETRASKKNKKGKGEDSSDDTSEYPFSLREGCLSDRNDGDDNTVETEGRTEDLDDKHLEEKLTLLCITDGGTTARDTDRNTAANIANTSCETSAKHQVASVVHGAIALLQASGLNLKLQNDSNDDTVDCHGLTEKNADKMLRSVRSLQARSYKTATSHIDTPVHTQTTHTHTHNEERKPPEE